ncbi:MAG: hypothetical protein H6722_30125 [Sandaracinus sp.]|nr:hypothetical protein [Sandaracinus sp.]
MRGHRMRWVWGVVLAMACGGESESAPTPTTDPTPTEATPTEATAEAPAEAPPAEAAPAEPAPIPEAELVDLLHAVRTEVATSSAYQNRDTQVRALVDGDLETAWNSRTDDLQGAWIEVRIPEGARVQSIRMTAGFTKTGSDGSDLFTGNHRVAKVKVSRDGTELGVAELDVDVRMPQALGDFGGGGGVYRLELTEMRPGTNERWREACISELQFLGGAPNAAAGARVPTVGIGTLPAAYVAPVADREEITRTHVNKVGQIGSGWSELLLASSGLDFAEPDDTEDLRPQRVRLLERAASWVEPVDADAAAALQARARAPLGESTSAVDATFAADVDALAAGLTAVANFVGDDAARCRTARANGGMRLELLTARIERPHDAGNLDEVWELDVPGIASEWRSNTRGSARQLERHGRPRAESYATLYDAVLADVAIARPACGW